MNRLAPTVLVLALAAPATALAQADHLLITEVYYDTTTANEPNEFIEIYNPTDVDAVLNDGTGAYYVSDDNNVYYDIVAGNVTTSFSSDWALTFPIGTTLPARSFLVITGDDVTFAAENFPTGGLAAFEAQPGSPQIFEVSVDADTVPDLVNVNLTAFDLSLTNGGEGVILYYWDGSSDLVSDVDHVCWVDTAELINKTGIVVGTSAYLADAGGAVAAPDAPQGSSLQRIHGIETAEVGTGGNGITGHDESTEDWDSSFVIDAPTPGRHRLVLDGDLADLALAGALTVSAADGPGTGAVADFGPDGTITELYALPVDDTGDGVADTLWVGVRGDFFDTSGTVNGTYVAFDVAPGTGNGLTVVPGTDLTGTLDSHITAGDVGLGAGPLAQDIAVDAIFGVTADPCASSDVCGLRGFGTDGVGGSTSDYAFLGDFTNLTDVSLGAVAAGLLGAAGTSYAAPDAIEFTVALTDLASPTSVALGAFTSGDGVGDPSPNTLPENADNTFAAVQLVDAVACVQMDLSATPVYYADVDGDTFGDPATAAAYCGTAPAALVLDGTDCDDSATGGFIFPGATETCDGVDQDCDGNIDEDFDADGDGFFDGTDAGCLATYGAANTDCNDALDTVGAGVAAAETCDGTDEDCDGVVDNGFDGDGDGAFDGADAGCVAQYGTFNVDCDDAEPLSSPNQVEICNGIDTDCDTVIDDPFDADGDGAFTDQEQGCIDTYGAAAVDCDDTNIDVFPGQTEVCDNSMDDDCDDDVDGDDVDCSGDDDDSAGDDDDAADDDDSAGDDDDATDDDDAADDDDDSGLDNPDTEGCTCEASVAGGRSSALLLLLPLAGVLRRRR